MNHIQCVPGNLCQAYFMQEILYEKVAKLSCYKLVQYWYVTQFFHQYLLIDLLSAIKNCVSKFVQYQYSNVVTRRIGTF